MLLHSMYEYPMQLSPIPMKYVMKITDIYQYFWKFSNMSPIFSTKSKQYQQSSKWLYSLVLITTTFKLYHCVTPTYNDICSSQYGRINLNKFVLDGIFLKIFESKGLTQFQGKNIYVITKQLHATAVSLDEDTILPDETYGDILCNFTKCSNEDFKSVSQHLLTQERIDHFSSLSFI